MIGSAIPKIMLIFLLGMSLGGFAQTQKADPPPAHATLEKPAAETSTGKVDPKHNAPDPPTKTPIAQPIPESDQNVLLKSINAWQSVELQIKQLQEQEKAIQQQYLSQCAAAVKKNGLDTDAYTCDVSNIQKMQFIPTKQPTPAPQK